MRVILFMAIKYPNSIPIAFQKDGLFQFLDHFFALQGDLIGVATKTFSAVNTARRGGVFGLSDNLRVIAGTNDQFGEMSMERLQMIQEVATQMTSCYKIILI